MSSYSSDVSRLGARSLLFSTVTFPKFLSRSLSPFRPLVLFSLDLLTVYSVAANRTAPALDLLLSARHSCLVADRMTDFDVLGSTPWQINRKIFDVVLEVWNAGYRLGKLPPAVHDEPEPEKTPEMETDQKARSVYIQCYRQWLVSKANNHSDRCSVNYKIEIAHAVSLILFIGFAASN